MSASRLLGAAAACVMLLSFATGHRKSYWSGCIKAAIVICLQISTILARVIFPLKNLLKSASKSCFFLALAPRSGLEAASSHAVARSSVVFCNSISRYRAVMAASRLLGAAAACVRLLSFAAGPRKSYWSCCIKAAIVICQQIFAILALAIFLLKLFLKFEVLQNRFFSLWRRHPLELQFLLPLCTGKFLCVKTSLCKSLLLCKLCSTK